MECSGCANPIQWHRLAFGPNTSKKAASEPLWVGCHCYDERLQLVLSRSTIARPAKAMPPNHLGYGTLDSCSDLRFVAECLNLGLGASCLDEGVIGTHTQVATIRLVCP
jgi:hypothetical protein